jgi:OOP family OmpA-OmpF porin
MTVKHTVATAAAAAAAFAAVLPASSLAQDYGQIVRDKPGPESRTGLYIYGAGGASRGNETDITGNIGANPALGPFSTVAADAKRNSLRVGVGYRFNRYFGIEGGYVDIGRTQFRGDPGTGAPVFTFTAKSRGGQAALVGFMPLTENFAFIAKLGVLYARTKYDDSTGISESENDVKPYFGLGLQYDLSDALFARAELERYSNIGTTRSTQTSFTQYHLGVGYRF